MYPHKLKFRVKAAPDIMIYKHSAAPQLLYHLHGGCAMNELPFNSNHVRVYYIPTYIPIYNITILIFLWLDQQIANLVFFVVVVCEVVITLKLFECAVYTTDYCKTEHCRTIEMADKRQPEHSRFLT